MRRWARLLTLTAPAASVLVGQVVASKAAEVVAERNVELLNWSGTHRCRPALYYEPTSVAEVETIMAEHHRSGRRLRAMGSGLSPNGIAFSDEALVNMGRCNRVLRVDPSRMRVTVEAGTRVREVTEALRPHGLVLQNYASIDEQQVGGLIQTGAHGTGACLPPMDEQVVALTVVTPAEGPLELSCDDPDPTLFRFAKVGLGALGIVTHVTLQCVKAHQLLEHTCTATVQEVHRDHAQRLRENKHLKYMWIPYTDTCVVVTCNPASSLPAGYKPVDLAFALAPLRSLLQEFCASGPPRQDVDIANLSFASLREKLLKVAPRTVDNIKRINEAEAEFWRRSQGYRLDTSDRILGFDCGGEQWVYEVCLDAERPEEGPHADLDFITRLLDTIERHKVLAPAPIEQRWTSASSAPLSPAHHADPRHLFSWIGIINYITSEDAALQSTIASEFQQYTRLTEALLPHGGGGAVHWAKIEPAAPGPAREDQLTCIRARFPLEQMNAIRQRLDPRNICSSPLLDTLLPRQYARSPA